MAASLNSDYSTHTWYTLVHVVVETFSHILHTCCFMFQCSNEPSQCMNQQLLSPISQLPLAKFQHVLILLLCCIFLCDIKFPIVMNLSLHELHEMFDLCGFFQYIACKLFTASFTCKGMECFFMLS